MNDSTLATPCDCCSGAAGGEDKGVAGEPERPRRGDDVALRHPGQPLDALRPVAGGVCPHRLETFGALADIGFVDQALVNQDVQQAVREDGVCAGNQAQVHRRLFGGRRPAWIDDDELPAGATLRVEVLHDRRHRLGDVGADEQDGIGAGDVRDGERQPAIEPESPQPGGGRRRHAEPAVVVDVGRAQDDARELAEEVDLLVGE